MIELKSGGHTHIYTRSGGKRLYIIKRVTNNVFSSIYREVKLKNHFACGRFFLGQSKILYNIFQDAQNYLSQAKTVLVTRTPY